MVRAIDTLLAIKALGLVPGLSANDRRIATVLLEHYNRRTGQCDPGLERIAQLLQISTRTVMRANRRLEAASLFRKVRHGGHLNRNSYEPKWTRFADLEAAWRRQFKKKNPHTQATNVSPEGGQPCHFLGDSAVTQTCRSNLQKETCSKSLPKKEMGDSVSFSPYRGVTEGTRPGEAALVEAERRWTDAVHRRFAALPVTHAEVIEAIDQSMRIAATEAEMKRRGDGLVYLLCKLKIGFGR
jgi:hypothetical protein